MPHPGIELTRLIVNCAERSTNCPTYPLHQETLGKSARIEISHVLISWNSSQKSHSVKAVLSYVFVMRKRSRFRGASEGTGYSILLLAHLLGTTRKPDEAGKAA